MDYLSQSILRGYLFLFYEENYTHKIGYEIGYFLGKFWPYVLAAGVIYLLIFLYKKNSKLNR